MKKVLIAGLAVLLLSGCGNKTEKEENTDNIFKDELVLVSEIGDETGRVLADEILVEDVEEVFNGIFDLAIFESHSEEYGEVTQGAGSDGNGGRVFCCKLPVDVKFTGSEASVERFVEYFEEIDNVVSFGDFNVEKIEDEKYEVNTVINFLGKAAGGNLTSDTKNYTVKKNAVEVKEEDKVSLRDFDVSMLIRPSNSDSSAISLGVMSDKDYRIYSDDNEKHDIKVTFSNEGSKYYCKCAIGDNTTSNVVIQPDSKILFDILSCEVIEADDIISADVHIINNSNKKVSVVIHDDEDGRVKVVEKVGSVEVK